MNKILFRADSSSVIGTGHIMRDLVLASKYKDANIVFAVQDLNGNINHKIVEAGYKIEILSSNDIEELDKLIKKLNIDMIVIDHYGIDETYEKQLKIKNSTLKILSFDDTYEKHHCDILLNHNISADERRYKELVPTECELRCGANYTLLREEFYQEKAIKRKKIYDVFVAMGGADHSNVNIKILEVLKNINNIQVVVVTTTANQHLKKLQRYSRTQQWVSLLINSNQIAKVMGQSRYAIVSPSVTVNEIHFIGIPFIAIKTADNQFDMYRFLKQKRFMVLKEFNKYKLKRKLCKLL